MVDIPPLLRRRNTNKSVEDQMNALYDYLLDEQYVIMNYKNEEEREKGGVKRQAHSNQEEENSFEQDQEVGAFAQQQGQRGGYNSRGRGIQRGSYGGGRTMTRGGARSRSMAPMKYPTDQAALKKAMDKLGQGRQPPMFQDCPLKCPHALPYGSCEYCENFEKKTLMEKQDIVKKNQLCRKCLRKPPIPHMARDCKAPNCAKCNGDHNTSICNNQTGTQELHSIQDR